MPRPTPQFTQSASAAAAEESAEEAEEAGGFEQLLCKLSGEYERLQQQLASLACENARLRTASSGGCPEPASCTEEVEVPRSKWASQVTFDASPSLKTWDTDVLEVKAALSAQSQRGSNGKSLREQFRRLDVNGTGKLYPDDVVRIMNKHAKDVGYESIINLIRVFNGLEAIDFTEGEACSFPQLGEELAMSRGIDFDTFKQLMHHQRSSFHMDPKIEQIVTGFQEACFSEFKQPKRYCSSYLPDFATQRSDTPEGSWAYFWLETVPTIVIILNTITTGVSADYPEEDDNWDIVERIFVGFYALEFLVKLKLYGCSGYFCGSGRWWNLFDFLCVALSLADEFVKLIVLLSVKDGNQPDLTAFLIIKVFRLARLARLVRTLRFKIFYELKLMILGVFSGLRVLLWAIVLLVILIYVVGVAMTNLMGKQEPEFDSVVSSMFTLFRCWTEGCAAYDGTPLAERLRMEYGFFFVVFHILMTMFVTVGVFNLIMAIFIENVVTSQVSRKSKEMGERTREIETKFKRLFTHFIKKGTKVSCAGNNSVFERALRELKSSDGKDDPWGWQVDSRKVDAEWDLLRNMNVTITRSAFKTWLQDDELQDLLDQADIESGNHFELFDVLDADMGGELSMDELTTGLMKLRGPVTKADIVAVRLKVTHLTSILQAAEARGGL